jgi:hypothetical protein
LTRETHLHLLVVEHSRPTYRIHGRSFRLIDVHGKVAYGIAGVNAGARLISTCSTLSTSMGQMFTMSAPEMNDNLNQRDPER